MTERPDRYRRPAPPRVSDPDDGVLLVDKPCGPTSHDVVAAIRHRFRIKKVGHGGTLDPAATGLLVILLGKGTKLSGLFIGGDKTYVGRMRLGVTTDSHDADGSILEEHDASEVTREQLDAQVAVFTGDLYQTPPMVSAVKVNGVPLYKRARRGETVERAPRLIHVYEFTLTGFTAPQADFVVRCTKGTYVRTLCHDIGQALGCGAHLDKLTRTACGDLRVDDALALDDVLALSREDLRGRLLPVRRFMA